MYNLTQQVRIYFLENIISLPHCVRWRLDYISCPCNNSHIINSDEIISIYKANGCLTHHRFLVLGERSWRTGKSPAAWSDALTASLCLGTVINYLDQEGLLGFVVSALNTKLGRTRVLIVGSPWKWEYKIALYLQDLIASDDAVLAGGPLLLLVFPDYKSVLWQGICRSQASLFLWHHFLVLYYNWQLFFWVVLMNDTFCVVYENGVKIKANKRLPDFSWMSKHLWLWVLREMGRG